MTMETHILKPGEDLDTDPAIGEAAELIADGQVVAVPTETVYGLAGDACNMAAVERIFAAKNRPADNPLIVHLHSLDMVYRYCVEVDPRVPALAEAFWPGPLTIVLKAGETLKNTVCRGLDSVAVRMPDHPVIRALIARVDRGLAAPSANLSGKPSPTRAADVYHDLEGRIPLILDGGPCRVGLESTVLDMTANQPQILRPGMITAAHLSEVLGCAVTYAQDEEARKRSPGTRYRHYSPEARVFLLNPEVSDASRSKLVRYLSYKGNAGYIGDRIKPGNGVAYMPESPQSLPAHLYHALRQMDEKGVMAVVIDGVEDRDEGLGLMDRLTKAASCHFHNDEDLIAWLEAERNSQR